MAAAKAMAGKKGEEQGAGTVVAELARARGEPRRGAATQRRRGEVRGWIRAPTVATTSTRAAGADEVGCAAVEGLDVVLYLFISTFIM